MEYNQNPRKSQAAKQANQFGKENIQGQKHAANPHQSAHEQQQGLGKKSQQSGSPYNKPANPKQHGKNANYPHKDR